MISMKY